MRSIHALDAHYIEVGIAYEMQSGDYESIEAGDLAAFDVAGEMGESSGSGFGQRDHQFGPRRNMREARAMAARLAKAFPKANVWITSHTHIQIQPWHRSILKKHVTPEMRHRMKKYKREAAKGIRERRAWSKGGKARYVALMAKTRQIKREDAEERDHKRRTTKGRR